MRLIHAIHVLALALMFAPACDACPLGAGLRKAKAGAVRVVKRIRHPFHRG